MGKKYIIKIFKYFFDIFSKKEIKKFKNNLLHHVIFLSLNKNYLGYVNYYKKNLKYFFDIVLKEK